MTWQLSSFYRENYSKTTLHVQMYLKNNLNWKTYLLLKSIFIFPLCWSSCILHLVSSRNSYIGKKYSLRGINQSKGWGMMEINYPTSIKKQRSRNRDIHIEYSKQFRWNLYCYVSRQSQLFWAALQLLWNSNMKCK